MVLTEEYRLVSKSQLQALKQLWEAAEGCSAPFAWTSLRFCSVFIPSSDFLTLKRSLRSTFAIPCTHSRHLPLRPRPAIRIVALIRFLVFQT